ncbi:hypothetical protein GZH49_12185 [Nocardia terpenica]|uniref:hypothetical protein n=1 Tax=Nocardia terpenica TaxID=455432 RepID=UPI002FE20374
MNTSPTADDSDHVPPSRPPVPVREAMLAAALHDVFDTCGHGPDNVETWFAIAAAATRWLTRSPQQGSRLPIFAIHRNQRTDAEYDPITGTVHITTGPLAGTHYPSQAHARHAITTHADTEGSRLPAWRMDHTKPGDTPCL